MDKMTSSRLRFEDQLKGASNFSPWKERIMLILIENNLWEFVRTGILPPLDVTAQATIT